MGATTSGTERFSLCLWTLFLKHVGNASKSFITLRIFFIPLAMQRSGTCVFSGQRWISLRPGPWRKEFYFFYCLEGGRDESERRRAESQWIVAARPLCHLQYPVAYLSRLQRIRPAARWKLYFKAARTARPPHGLNQRHVPLGARGPLLLVGKRAAGVRVASSPDSDLEAFSHNPAHGSFAPLAFQPSAMTNCANQRFLSY